MILIDTNIVIDPPNVWPDSDLGLSVLCIAELHFGVQLARNPAQRAERMRRLVTFRAVMEGIAFDEYAAESYGLLAAEVSRKRSSHARSKDIMLAAQAHSLGAAVMTRNTRDFELVSHLVEIIAPD